MLDEIKSALGLGEKKPLYMRPLKKRDVDAVLAIERQGYNYPWGKDIFADCLRVGYSNWAFIKDGRLIGYAILSIAAGEAHILNICIDPWCKGQGLGTHFLNEIIQTARSKKVGSIFLEVRASNTAAIALYNKSDFKQLGQRKNYYPAADGREDAIVFSLDISADAQV
ncbi:MAG: ribosomal-protein-alanine N-acetyltransferase RimI [Cycloclasticus sp. symbiont of Poecilosclerida sp. N]|nr:MAG: ribosomal-protein-alanine N-acetyltransferase RimI [Cycloclasticus sp. symbiont of Poecilosclerida sp. N]